MIVDRLISRAPGFVPKLIVHVGAHKGGEAARYEALGIQRVIWIEADDETAAIARHKLARRDGPTAHTVVHALITDTDGTPTPFHVFSNKGGSSSIFRATEAFREHWPEVRETGRVKTLTSSRLDTVLGGLSVRPDEVEVLVMDVQGAELLCLKGAGRYLDHAVFVEVEVSAEAVYDGGALAPAVDAFLAGAGFVRVSDMRWHGDVVYMRQGLVGRGSFAAIVPA